MPPPPVHRVEVDLDRLEENARRVVRRAGRRRVLAVVKADAYGHGAVHAARAFRRGGVHGFTVFLPEEGMQLRDAGIDAPVIVVGPILPERLTEALDADLVPTVHCRAGLEALAAESRRRPGPLPFHLKVDTGMGRLGFPVDELHPVLETLAGMPALTMTGLLSHLACAEDPRHPLNAIQRARFGDALRMVAGAGHRPAEVHLANSAWMLRGEPDPGNTVRPGLLLYGLSPAPALPAEDVQPALRFRTRVVQLKDLPTGATLGYGATWKAPSPRRIAALPVGYAEGIPRGLDRGGEVLVRGRRCPIVGRVSMDLTTVDVTQVRDVAIDTPVTLLGEERGERIHADDWALVTGAIPWEILCGIPGRLARSYVRRGGQAAG